MSPYLVDFRRVNDVIGDAPPVYCSIARFRYKNVTHQHIVVNLRIFGRYPVLGLRPFPLGMMGRRPVRPGGP